MIDTVSKKASKLTSAIFIIWIFHISGIIGIYFGNTSWFISKSPLNLIISLGLFIWLFPIDSKKKWLFFFLFFLVGMFVEWLGVNYGLLFGDYSYGKNLGPKLDGVPFLIGSYWSLLTFVTAQIAHKLGLKKWSKIIFGAFLMVTLDFFMEKSAPIFDFWQFEGHVPIDNYIAWFAIGLLLHLVLHKSKIQGNKEVSIHLYLAQVLFFAVFYCFPIQ